jgi:ribosomal RNA-processing protein 1
MCRSIILTPSLVVAFWHSDKPGYQKEVAEKITHLLTEVGAVHGLER